MIIWLLIGVGGGLGAMARHGLNTLVRQSMIASDFPLGIFLVNVVGSAMVGVIAGLITSSRLEWGLEMRTFVVVGLLGGFTTFSSFSLDTLTLARSGHPMMAAWNVLGQVALSLLAVAAGYRLGSH